GGLMGDGLREILGLDLFRVADQVAAGAGDMATAADQPGEVGLLLQGGGVDDGAGVADQQHPGVAVGQRLSAGLGERRPGALVADAQVAVQVREPRDDESVDLEQFGARRQFRPQVVEAAADDPGFVDLLLRADEEGAPEMQHRVLTDRPLLPGVDRCGRGGVAHAATLSLVSASQEGGSPAAEQLLHLRGQLAGIEVGQVRFALLGAGPESGAALAAAGRGLACGLGLLARRLGGILRLGLLLAAGGGLLAAPRFLAHPHAGSARHARHPRHAAASHAAAHALHHLLSLLEALEQLVDLLHGGAGAPRDASPGRASSDSAKLSSASRYWTMFGPIPSIFLMLRMFFSGGIWERKSSRVKSSPEASFAAAFSASPWSKAFSACSIRVRTSPMSRMPLAIRSGRKRSKPSMLASGEANRTGRWVTPAVDSPRPPRPS